VSRSLVVAVALVFVLVVLAGCAGTAPSNIATNANCRAVEIFPAVREHVHASTIVELPNGDFVAAWFQGSGERWADDVRIMGARLPAGADKWSELFLMADTPGFPDINPILFMDAKNRLWLVWYTVIANQWETSLLKYRISEDFSTHSGPPKWVWQDVLHVKPGDSAERGIQPGDRFVESIERQVEQYATYLQKEVYAAQADEGQAAVTQWKARAAQLLAKARGEDMTRRGILQGGTGQGVSKDLGYPYFRRMGWQTKNKAVLLEGGRLIVPLYSDGFGFSLMAITDDGGEMWQFSEPLVAAGDIQPSIARKSDGTLVAYMRDSGPPPKRLHVSTSSDRGMTWSPVRDSELPNPGSGADIVTLRNGHWVLAYNDTEQGRHSLAISLSTDEGKTWSRTRHLEHYDPDAGPTAAYPSIIQAADGSLHVVYSYRRDVGQTIKHVRFTESWLASQ
jgi:predicted neuraminidase